MLLPDKHISLAESLFGLGAFVLRTLSRPMTTDALHDILLRTRGTSTLPAFHDFDGMILAILFLYSVGAVEMDHDGLIRRCAS